MKKLIIVILAIALLVFVGCQEEKSTVDVVGESVINTEPSQAEVWAGVSIVKDSAEAAQNEVNSIVNAMTNGLKDKGISEDDISTERLNLYEERQWENGKSITKGWRASQTLKIRTEDLSKVGEIVDVAVSNGANQLNDIYFSLTSDEEQNYKKEALAKATENAKEKAEVIADSLDAKLGKIVSVSEPNYNFMPYRYTLAEAGTDNAKIVEEAATIMPSDVEIKGRASIVYEIKS